MNAVPEASRPEANRSPRETIRKLLQSLYGSSRAREVEGRLRGLMDRCVSAPDASTREAGPEWISQQDVLLITYADQVRKGGERPLKVLAEFCACHLKGVVSGIHLLPFYP
jgi:hypothetical protein